MTASDARTDGRLARGERTRVAVLDAAVALASEVGLEGLSLAQLAQRLDVSKSGLFAHWRDKQDLQLATIERAREQWIDRIVSPALAAPCGVRRLWALHESRLAFYFASTLPGGCFFAKVEFEYGTRPGPVRDRVVEIIGEWLALFARLAREAIELGEMSPVNVDQLAFEIDAAGVAAVYQSRLLDPATVRTNARRAVLDRLRPLCADPTLLPEE